MKNCYALLTGFIEYPFKNYLAIESEKEIRKKIINFIYVYANTKMRTFQLN